MPAKSKKQAIAMAIAEHAPSKLYSRNLGMTQMSKSQLHDFASTPRKGLPVTAPPTPTLKSASKAVQHDGSHPIRNLQHFAHGKKGR